MACGSAKTEGHPALVAARAARPLCGAAPANVRRTKRGPMGMRIKRAAVLGAGVMGQGIAAQLANAGIPSYLFDIAPQELTDAEAEAGLTLEDRRVRNRVSDAGIAAMEKAKPALLYRQDLASLVTACNYEDDLDKLAECDWIVEVVVERMDIKQRVFEMVDDHRKPGSVVSSNTSGLSAAAMAEGRSDDFRRHFMVTHFFNPVRYMRLLEMVPVADTDPEVFAGDGRLRRERARQGHRLLQGHAQLHRQPHRHLRDGVGVPLDAGIRCRCCRGGRRVRTRDGSPEVRRVPHRRHRGPRHDGPRARLRSARAARTIRGGIASPSPRPCRA